MTRRHRSRLVLLLCLSVFVGPTCSQTYHPLPPDQLSADDKSNITETLRLKSKTPLEFKRTRLKARRSYTLFLGTRTDFESEAILKAWVEKWNATQARKFGRILLTDELQEAELIVVQYLDRLTEITETIIAPVKLIVNGEVIIGSAEYKYSPLHSYILLPQKDGFVITWHHQKQVRHDWLPTEKVAVNRKLTSELAALLKRR